MRFYLIVTLLLVAVFYSCDHADKKEATEIPQKTDSITKVVDTTTKITVQYLKTDYPDRVWAFKKMRDASIEEQVVKYERFSALFIEYVGIDKSKPLYAPQDQLNNVKAYDILRDEMVSLKEKLRKNMASMSKAQENRLDSADARMNKFLPQVYK